MGGWAGKENKMGQYYLVVNLDKREYLHPGAFCDGMKLLEFGDSSSGTMTALAILLADGNGRGGGDLHSNNPIVGSWAGDRIIVAGDYANGNKWIEEEDVEVKARIAKDVFTEGHQEPEHVTLYHFAKHMFTDVSFTAISAMCEDHYLARALNKRGV